MNSVLLISTCYFEFHELEFVRPIKQLCEQFGWKTKIVNYEELDEKHIKNIEKIIICGTALKDDEYFEEAEVFGHLFTEFEGKILGICAGAQLLGAYYNGDLIEKKEIGLIKDIQITKKDSLLKEVSLKEVYALHNFAVENIECEILAQNEIPQIFKNNNHYGVLFHPEIRNHKIIENFLNL